MPEHHEQNNPRQRGSSHTPLPKYLSVLFSQKCGTYE
jgi:hypothetical protein